MVPSIGVCSHRSNVAVWSAGGVSLTPPASHITISSIVEHRLKIMLLRTQYSSIGKDKLHKWNSHGSSFSILLNACLSATSAR